MSATVGPAKCVLSQGPKLLAYRQTPTSNSAPSPTSCYMSHVCHSMRPIAMALQPTFAGSKWHVIKLAGNSATTSRIVLQ